MTQAELFDALQESGFWNCFPEYDAVVPIPETVRANVGMRHAGETPAARCRKWAYKQGKKAFVENFTRCPYKVGTVGHELWNEGFEAAKQQKASHLSRLRKYYKRDKKR